MAIYHFNVSIVSRGKGHSAVAAAAGLSGTKLYDERLGRVANHSRKKGVLHAEIMALNYAPDWMRDRARLWHGVEAAGIRKDAQLARTVQVALTLRAQFCRPA